MLLEMWSGPGAFLEFRSFNSRTSLLSGKEMFVRTVYKGETERDESEGNNELANALISSTERLFERMGVVRVLCLSLFLMNL